MAKRILNHRQPQPGPGRHRPPLSRAQRNPHCLCLRRPTGGKGANQRSRSPRRSPHSDDRPLRHRRLRPRAARNPRAGVDTSVGIALFTVTKAGENSILLIPRLERPPDPRRDPAPNATASPPLPSSSPSLKLLPDPQAGRRTPYPHHAGPRTRPAAQSRNPMISNLAHHQRYRSPGSRHHRRRRRPQRSRGLRPLGHPGRSHPLPTHTPRN